MAEGDTFKSVKAFIKAQPNTNKIKERLSKLIALGNKKPRYTPPMQPTVGVQFLTPEDIQKGLNNFDVIDYTGHYTLIGAGQTISDDVIELLKQLIEVNPKAIYIRQNTEIDKPGQINSLIGL